MSREQERRFDFVVVGSGFGGAVSAMRLSQKGYRVAIVEEGRRFRAEQLPKTNWNIFRYLWAPSIGCFGIQSVTLLRGLMVLGGKGVGGGSLVYANTLMAPHSRVLAGPSWPESVEWNSELTPHYESARRMFGVVANPRREIAEDALFAVGKQMGIDHTFHPTEVGVFFGAGGKITPGETVKDPYFSGAGPDRTGCTGCGGCMVGCRNHAKNTLESNYLFFAEKWGAKIFPRIRARKVIPEKGGYRVETSKTSVLIHRPGPVFHADKVVLAAGVLGTVDLLFRNRDVFRTLPEVSQQLGSQVCTNGESLVGVTSLQKDKDYSAGVAIGAAIHPDDVTKIEAVKYPSGSSSMRVLAVPLTPEGSRLTRPLKLVFRIVCELPRLFWLAVVRDWAKRTIILLTMQSTETRMRLFLQGRTRRKRLSGRSMEGPFPTYLPVAQAAASHLAREMQGVPQNVISEVLLGVPATAHVLGGCCMAEGPDRGVVGPDHQVYGYPGLYVCDASVIPSNLGVNPSLTIAALAERFAAQFPDRDARIRQEREIRFSSRF